MKPEMHETEISRLELRLRQRRPKREPTAPQSLRTFVAEVPVATSPRGRLAVRLGEAPSLRRGAGLAGIAATLVLAILVSSLLIDIRSGQIPGPPGSAGWTWQRADGSAVSSIFSTAHGYVGVCRSAVAPADSMEQLQQAFSGAASLCSSSDGTTWTSPPDPSIVNAAAGFRPTSYARAGSTYVATSSSALGGDQPVWYSSDGVSWRPTDEAQFEGLSVFNVLALNGRLYALAMGDPSGALFATDNGADWSRVSELPVTPNFGGFAITGDRIAIGASDGDEWVTYDGVHWEKVALPAGVDFLGVLRVGDGDSVAFGSTSASPVLKLLRSSDGIDWAEDQGDLGGGIVALVTVGDRLVASVLEEDPASSVTGSALYKDLPLWQSLDWGRTWLPLLGPDGTQLAGFATTIGDKLGVDITDEQGGPHLEWVGTLAPVEQATPPATNTPSTHDLAPAP
jgi:hypothetical protein